MSNQYTATCPKNLGFILDILSVMYLEGVCDCVFPLFREKLTAARSQTDMTCFL